ncbi:MULTISPECIES: Dabb family protein [Nitratireductor]|uniref:Stress-response A/B barrel domain-containing protein n=1 Tax=Nitratireductor pacificus pht-3B TaxID=391937 RepID=K2MCS0_9HYPH|nr:MULTISPECIES: Dabb family protein [Nitratireductor]EKF18555.1 hypothetical protein NA2_12948 [Nitratireductor pacificus pht-3B]MDS1138773.1 Dabb family protein [Nitratireductor indicus]
MIKHIVMFRFRREVTADQKRALLMEYPDFPDLHPQMKAFDIGRNRSRRDSWFDYAFVIELKSWDDLDRYLEGAEHEDHVVSRFRPLIEDRAIVSFEYTPGTHDFLGDPLG